MISSSKKVFCWKRNETEDILICLFVYFFQMITCIFCLKCKISSHALIETLYLIIKTCFCKKRSGDYIYDEESNDEEEENPSGIVRHEH